MKRTAAILFACTLTVTNVNATPPARAEYTWARLEKAIADQVFEVTSKEGGLSGGALRLSQDQLSIEVRNKGVRTVPLTGVRNIRDRRGTRIRMTLQAGARIEATLLEAQQQGLAVWVTKTSNHSRQPKGLAILPKEQVRHFDLVSQKGRSVMIGTLTGLGVGAAIGAGIAQATPEEGIGIIVIPVAAVGIAAIGTITGYSIGRAMRWRVTEVTVVP